MRYRFFRSPPSSTTQAGAVTVTLLGQPLGEDQSLQDFASYYLDGREVLQEAEVTRPTARGRRWQLVSPDGATRSGMILLEEAHHVFGLHISGEAARYTELEADLREMLDSFTLERPGSYEEVTDRDLGYSLRIPPTWQQRTRFSRGDTAFVHWTSPSVAIDPGPHTVHASLSLAIEPAPGDGSLDAYYDAIKLRLGDTYTLLAHDEWPDGFVDVMRTETAMAMSRSRRYYRVADGRGYSLTCESRDDVQHRVFRWCDMIAATLRIGSEVEEES